jgi:hypothetical protein
MIVNSYRAHNVDGMAYCLTAARSVHELIHGTGLSLVCSDSYSEESTLSPEDFRELLQDGITLVRELTAVWERGHLAGAVNSLESWANGAKAYAIDYVPNLGVDPETVVEVSLSAFSDWNDLSAFAQDVGALLECGPEVIIRSMAP